MARNTLGPGPATHLARPQHSGTGDQKPPDGPCIPASPSALPSYPPAIRCCQGVAKSFRSLDAPPLFPSPRTLASTFASSAGGDGGVAHSSPSFVWTAEEVKYGAAGDRANGVVQRRPVNVSVNSSCRTTSVLAVGRPRVRARRYGRQDKSHHGNVISNSQREQECKWHVAPKVHKLPVNMGASTAGALLADVAHTS